MTELGQYMQDNGMTDAALAESVNCDRSMINKIRHGVTMPSLPLALAISEATGVSVVSLMPVRSPEKAGATT